jgi:exosortase D (VPLPA-CTERM-specific)
VRREPALLFSVPIWQFAILGGILIWLYWSILGHLILQWWQNPNFSHGFFVPMFSAFVIWQERDQLARRPVRPSWWGLPILAFALCVLVVGQMGAELFLSRLSLLLVLAGLIVLFFGWTLFRAMLFPWAFLVLMIPIPAILFNEITFPLQLLASRVAATTLPIFGVPVLREGNLIILAAMPLEVAEACSGIRSLMSLVTLAIIYGYLMERRLWMRCLLAVASVPIAVLANSARIIGTGLLVQYWDPDKAEGYFHASWGWIVFVISLVMLYSLHRLLDWLLPSKDGEAQGKAPEIQAGALAKGFGGGSSIPRFVLATLIIGGTATLLQAHSRAETFPPRQALQSFPEEIGALKGTDIPIDKDALEVLGAGEFLLRDYANPDGQQPAVNLYIAYFPTQRAGDTIHSPKNCLPGAGWAPVQSSRTKLSVPGHGPFPVNRYVIAKGDLRQLVFYWYWAHDRGVASEYWAKYYLVADSIRMNRSDGALVRVTTLLSPGESAEAAEQRVLPFVNEIVPKLDSYIPR